MAEVSEMNENPAANNWIAARGEKWRAQLAGMEAMLAPVDEPLIHALNLDAPQPQALHTSGCQSVTK